jgi:hypothetical protein
LKFDPTSAQRRIEKLWSLKARFGLERAATDVFLNELVSDRYALVRGLTLLRDELQLAGARDATGEDIEACGADFSLPSVVTTVAHTNCGDRIHQGEAMTAYKQIVAARFATLSEIGELKVEAFSPTGGGTDDGATLAHVTVGHQLDEPLRRVIYDGNAQSCVLVGIDLMTHVGRLDEGGVTEFGRTRESPWREPRAACGAIVGAISAYNPDNGVHRRLRRDLGEENFAHLLQHHLRTQEGDDISAVVAASIVAIQGMRNVVAALVKELDERGVAHVTSSLTVNRVNEPDTVIYLGRATAFGGEMRVQGFGTKATRYGGRMVTHEGDRRLELHYEGADGTQRLVKRATYKLRQSGAHAPSARVFESSDDLPPMGDTLNMPKPDLAPPAPAPRRRLTAPPLPGKPEPRRRPSAP